METINKILNKEEWKDITGYEGYYQISNMGRVMSLALDIHYIDGRSGRECNRSYKSKILKHTLPPNWYPVVGLTKSGKQKTYTIHRLIAIHFIPNPNNYPHINHINGNKLDYTITNLEWCTAAQNCKHSIIIGLRDFNGSSNPRATKCIIKKGNFIKEFGTLKEAASFINVNEMSIYMRKRTGNKVRGYTIL